MDISDHKRKDGNNATLKLEVFYKFMNYGDNMIIFKKAITFELCKLSSFFILKQPLLYPILYYNIFKSELKILLGYVPN